VTSPSASASGTDTPTTAGTSAAPVPDVFHRGTLPISYGQLVDLDASPTDPNWGVLDHPPGWDLTWNGTTSPDVAMSFESGAGAVGSTQDGRDCQSAVGFSTNIPLTTARPLTADHSPSPLACGPLAHR
jgi:hypothetical protein